MGRHDYCPCCRPVLSTVQQHPLCAPLDHDLQVGGYHDFDSELFAILQQEQAEVATAQDPAETFHVQKHHWSERCADCTSPFFLPNQITSQIADTNHSLLSTSLLATVHSPQTNI